MTFFGNFSTQNKRYYFCMEGSMWGGHEVRMPMQGDFVWWRKQLNKHTPKSTHMHLVPTWGDFVWWRGQSHHARWMQGENAHAGQMRGENGHTRWLCVVEGTTRHTHPQSHLAWGEVDMRWECPCAVDVRCTSHLVKFFTPWYSVVSDFGLPSRQRNTDH